MLGITHSIVSRPDILPNTPRLETIQTHGRLHYVEFADVLQPFHRSALDVSELHVAHPCVEKALVHRVDHVVHDLQPVAVLYVLGPDL